VKRTKPPFIIWTLRRTGGTNLADHIGVKHHEPFNKDRVFGEVSTAWIETKDETGLQVGVKAALKGNPSIKHCVETVPEEVTRELVRQSVKKGYQHIFLIRRKPHGRVLSLQFAESFDIWGADHARKRSLGEVEAAVADQDLPINSMIRQEVGDREALRFAYEQILSLDVTPAIAVFEDIYDAFNAPLSIALFDRICGHVGAARPQSDEEVNKILFSGGQNTNDKYKLYRNYDEYLEKIAGIGEFALGGILPDVTIDRSSLPEDTVVEIFKPRQSWRSDLIKVEGLAFHSASTGLWQLTADGLNLSVIWNLPSPTFANKRGNKAANASRFVALDVTFENATKLQLSLSN
jgi:hypothetical protein